MNIIYLILIILYYINFLLPNSGKFIIKKYTDEKNNKIIKVTLNDPSSVMELKIKYKILFVIIQNKIIL